MSIESQIIRIATNVNNAKNAISLKGVPVPRSATSDDLASLISRIQRLREEVVVVHAKGNPMTDSWSGIADMNYSEIIKALTGDGDPLAECVVGNICLAGYGQNLNVYCMFELDPNGATYQQEREAYGADKIQGVLMSIDTTLQTVEFLFTNANMSDGVCFKVDANGIASGV